MMTGDDIRNQRQIAEKLARDGDASLALWVIAEQLYEISHHLAAFREVIDPASGENFPAYIRTKDIG